MKAKEMFKELGYKLVVDDANKISYNYKNTHCFIEFLKKYKEVCAYEYDNHDSTPASISLEEMKAINKQIEELGWLE